MKPTHKAKIKALKKAVLNPAYQARKWFRNMKSQDVFNAMLTAAHLKVSEMKLNTENPFVTRVGGDPNGIRYIQNGIAFNGAKKPIGTMNDGKFTALKNSPVEPVAEPVVVPAIVVDVLPGPVIEPVVEPESAVIALEAMKREDLLKMARETYALSVPSNIGTPKLIERIKEAQDAQLTDDGLGDLDHEELYELATITYELDVSDEATADELRAAIRKAAE